MPHLCNNKLSTKASMDGLVNITIVCCFESYDASFIVGGIEKAVSIASISKWKSFEEGVRKIAGLMRS
jgi:hypothetical protein